MVLIIHRGHTQLKLPLNQNEERFLTWILNEYLDLFRKGKLEKAANLLIKNVKPLSEILAKLVKQHNIIEFKPMLNIILKILSYFHGKHQHIAPVMYDKLFRDFANEAKRVIDMVRQS